MIQIWAFSSAVERFSDKEEVDGPTPSVPTSTVIYMHIPEQKETFFTIIGCIDGRCQQEVADYGKQKFGALYPDTITEAGLVGILAHNPSPEFLESLKKKIMISLEKHHSKGILIDGHEECAGNPVSDEQHKDDIRVSVAAVKSMIHSSVPVLGVFVKRNSDDPIQWVVEEVSGTLTA